MSVTEPVEMVFRDVDRTEARNARRQVEVVDPVRHTQLANGELSGHVQCSTTTITDNGGIQYRLKPTRMLMPSMWHLAGSNSTVLYTIRRPPLFQLLNPFSRTYLAVRNLTTQVEFVLVNESEDGLPNRLFGPRSTQWCLRSTGQLVARLDRRRDARTASRSRFTRTLQPTHWVMLNEHPSPGVPAPVFLALMLLFESLLNR